MRILIVNTVQTGRNGVTNVIFNLCNAMNRKDIIFDYISVNEPDNIYTNAIHRFGGNVFVLNRNVRNPIGYLIKLRRIILKGKYDIVHAHGNSATLALEMVAALSCGCRVRIAHGHSTSCHFTVIHRVLLPLFRACCTHRLACGEAAGKWLYGKRTFHVVKNGVDTSRFAFNSGKRAFIREKFGIATDDLVIGNVGSFISVKNQTFLVDIMRELTVYDKRCRLFLVGEGPLRGCIEEKVLKLNLEENVIFIGETDYPENFLSACDIVVMPSIYEGVPLSLIEAQANGLLCLVSDTVSSEVDKTGNLIFCSLSDGAEKWANIIQKNVSHSNRFETSQSAIVKITQGGFDIRTNAAELRKYYFEIKNETYTG